MTKTKNTNKLSLILCIVLIAAMALFTAGCNDNSSTGETESPKATQEETTDSSETTASDDTDALDVKVLGEGSTEFFFNVVDKAGKETKFEIHTDEKVVGDALVKLELISGEAGAYSLYVKEVNGIKADYDTDGTYWAFYINGEYAMTGVDTTDITKGYTYSFKVEK